MGATLRPRPVKKSTPDQYLDISPSAITQYVRTAASRKKRSTSAVSRKTPVAKSSSNKKRSTTRTIDKATSKPKRTYRKKSREPLSEDESLSSAMKDPKKAEWLLTVSKRHAGLTNPTKDLRKSVLLGNFLDKIINFLKHK